MTTWNETHYARAQEFTRLLSAALAAAQAAAPTTPAIERTAPPFSRPASPPSPAPAALVPPAPLPAVDPTPPPPSPAPAAGPSAASVFKKIPWKK